MNHIRTLLKPSNLSFDNSFMKCSYEIKKRAGWFIPNTQTCIALIIFAIFLAFTNASFGGECVTIKSGALFDSTGSVINMGFDKWGYNYQAHMFNGKYCQAYQNASWCQTFADIDLEMKWNDAWLSNKDCDRDGKLDIHYGHEGYRGSGAWLTINQKGFFTDKNGKKQQWSSLEKIVAVPLDASLKDGKWYSPDGTEIGTAIWDHFAVTMRYVQSTGAKVQGVLYLSPFNGKSTTISQLFSELKI